MKRFIAPICLATLMPVLASAQVWSDSFDTYANGTDLHGVGGWSGWDNTPSATAFVRNVVSHTSPHSVEITGGADLVHEYTPTTGTWVYETRMWVPSSMTSGETYFILMNNYNVGPTAPKSWSVQMHFNTGGAITGIAANSVVDDFMPAASRPNLTILRDQWAWITVEIDLDNNRCKQFYAGQSLEGAVQRLWRDTNDPNSLQKIAAVDLYANNVGPVYYDTMVLSQSLAPLSIAVTGGIPAGGGLTEVLTSDDTHLFVICDELDSIGRVEATTNFATPLNRLTFVTETRSARTDQTLFYQLKRASNGVWENIGFSLSTSTDTTNYATSTAAGPYRAANGDISGRIVWIPSADIDAGDGWNNVVDYIRFWAR